MADPKDPVYPSNLSAALYELGDYRGSVDAVCRSWALLKNNSDVKVDLIVRLSIRLAKALCHGVRAGTISEQDLGVYQDATSQLRDASTGSLATTAKDDLARSWKEWDATQSECIAQDSQRVDACLSGLSRLPLFCKPLYVLSTRFTILPYNVLTFPPETTRRSFFQSVNRISLSALKQYSYSSVDRY